MLIGETKLGDTDVVPILRIELIINRVAELSFESKSLVVSCLVVWVVEAIIGVFSIGCTIGELFDVNVDGIGVVIMVVVVVDDISGTEYKINHIIFFKQETKEIQTGNWKYTDGAKT